MTGGSWGSTLSLAYSEAYPERVLGMIVRGIFLGTSEEVQWFYQDGTNTIFPDYWEDFVTQIPEGERHDMLAAYHKRLIGDNEIARMGAAKAWSLWEARTATISPTAFMLNHFSSPHTALSVARLETHYFVNNCFFRKNQLLEDAHILSDIPVTIVHGRYDMICRMKHAYDLKNALPLADFVIASASGHAANEPGISAALIKAGDDMLGKLL